MRKLLTSTARLETRETLNNRQAGGALELREVSEAGEFEGHGSVFGVEDSYGDIVAPGAFQKTLEEHRAAGTLPVMLWQHDTAQPIGVYTEMREDSRGLFVKGKLLTETAKGKEAHAFLKAKAIRGLSIGFMTRGYEWDETSQIRTVTDIDLWEVSLVTFPANRQAGVEAVKNNELATERDLEKFLRDAGMSKTEAKATIARFRSSILDRRDASEGIGKSLGAAERLLQSIQGN